ncbi:MAG TPA: ABC transporter substrate-binding protein [Thermoclostridium caenicola]|uniref:ABC transporter substrate-binding protein n=1 Tax=Thermoclostridium caenicola TaxID=659425 RepID=UPI002B5FE89D|nr:ABC transporter substrate-binding protein [Thermoclostridium caenicola]HOK42652.1 ABC transporter substrate-binding protein [Thermoclostridium caenicola]HOL84308.1 ABC transporter substrate-binding protein [Thermoclostridium caenicola]HPO75654.1 ABC transporter substrate-binding protein [Thermoclostridium caenicola]
MGRYIVKRVFLAVVTIWLVATITFFLMFMVPGGPFLAEKSPSPATLEALNRKYGLDQPVIVQYKNYMLNLLKGELGESIKQRGRTVGDIISRGFKVSARVGGISILVSVLIGVPVPGQAKDVQISDDGTVYTFTLRDGLKWSDGKPVTASDFVYAWNRAIDPETAADYAYMFEVIEGYEEGKLNVTAPDDKTVVVKLKNRVPYFLELTAFPAFSPVRKDIIEQHGDAWATKPETYIGNGPYKVTEWVPGSHITMTKNENYWNYKNLGMQNIKFVLMDDPGAQLNAFIKGEILFTDDIPNDEIDTWKDKPEFHLEGQLGTYYVSFNTQREYLNNPKVRQALILAVDREFIVREIGKAGQVPAGAFVPIGLSDADPSKEFRDVGGNYYDPSDYEGNLEKAKQILAEAGYPNGQGLPAFEYLYNSESEGHRLIGEALQDMWGKLGVKINLVSQEWATFLNTRKNGDYDIARNGWLGDYNDPISFLDMWITNSGNNDAQWSNPEYDKLISQIKTETDTAKRFELMHKAEDMIFDDWMLCPIYYYVDIFVLNTKVENFWSSPLGFKYFMYATVKE